MPICATPTDQPRPIIQAVCRNGFDGVGIGYIQRLATHLEVDHTGLSLLCLILDIAKKVIPVGEHCVQLWTSILDKKKRVAFEYDADIEKGLRTRIHVRHVRSRRSAFAGKGDPKRLRQQRQISLTSATKYVSGRS